MSPSDAVGRQLCPDQVLRRPTCGVSGQGHLAWLVHVGDHDRNLVVASIAGLGAGVVVIQRHVTGRHDHLVGVGSGIWSPLGFSKSGGLLNLSIPSSSSMVKWPLSSSVYRFYTINTGRTQEPSDGRRALGVRGREGGHRVLAVLGEVPGRWPGYVPAPRPRCRR